MMSICSLFDCGDGSPMFTYVKTHQIIQFEYVHMCNLLYVSYIAVFIFSIITFTFTMGIVIFNMSQVCKALSYHKYSYHETFQKPIS